MLTAVILLKQFTLSFIYILATSTKFVWFKSLVLMMQLKYYIDSFSVNPDFVVIGKTIDHTGDIALVWLYVYWLRPVGMLE